MAFDSKLSKRILTALIALPIILVSIYYGGYAFLAFMLLLSFLCLNEFLFLVRKTKKSIYFSDILVYLISFALVVSALLPQTRQFWSLLSVEIFMILVVVFFLLEFFQEQIILIGGELKGAVRSILYIGMMFPSYILIREMSPQGLGYLLFITFTIWFNDTFAYFIGLAFGKHKLNKKLSPKKSLEGAWGGFLAAVTFSYFAGPAVGFASFQAVTIGAVISLLAQAGDLLESLFKRTVNAKDSSSLLPGHGGFLDRMDSFILAGPIFYLILVHCC